MTPIIPAIPTLSDSSGALAALETVLFFLEQRGGLGVTPGHHRRVQLLSLALAQQLGVSDGLQVQLSIAALFHDIGQIALPDGLLKTPGRLTPHDYESVKTHPLHGVQILQHVISEPEALGAIRHHHEQFGGGGYPDGLSGLQIPLLARILAVPEVFDAMAHRRPWREPMALDRVRDLIAQYRGNLFDPMVIEAFMSIDRAWLVENFTDHPGQEHSADPANSAHTKAAEHSLPSTDKPNRLDPNNSES